MTLGFWSMLYDPIHFAVFVLLCCLVPVLLYTAYILHSLYLVMGEAYIDVSDAQGQYNNQCDMFDVMFPVRVVTGAGELQRGRG